MISPIKRPSTSAADLARQLQPLGETSCRRRLCDTVENITPSSREFVMPATTIDCKGQIIAMGDRVRVLDITPDPDLDEEDLDMFMGMVGAVCDIERIDADGAAWVALWWNGDEGTVLTQIGLAPGQMEKVSA
jgi:hypothetical protein